MRTLYNAESVVGLTSGSPRRVVANSLLFDYWEKLLESGRSDSANSGRETVDEK
jgi:hypothetical protein